MASGPASRLATGANSREQSAVNSGNEGDGDEGDERGEDEEDEDEEEEEEEVTVKYFADDFNPNVPNTGLSRVLRKCYSLQLLRQFEKLINDLPADLDKSAFKEAKFRATKVAENTRPPRASRANYPRGGGKANQLPWENDHSGPSKRPRAKVISAPRESVALKKSDNAWTPSTLDKPKKPVTAEEEDEQKQTELLKRAAGDLNKITMETFDKLSDRMIETARQLKDEHMTDLIGLVFERVQLQHHFSGMYAKLCSKMSKVLDQDARSIAPGTTIKLPPTSASASGVSSAM
jgi:hypothetical protein